MATTSRRETHIGLRRIGITLTTAVLLAGATPVSAQVEQGTADDAQVGEAYRVGDRRPLNFTLTSARHALGWTRHERYGTPTKDEKMLIVHFRVENVGEDPFDFAYNSLEFTATDDQSVGYERENPIAVYVEGREGELDATLVPGQAIDAYTAIIVPADRAITGLAVTSRERGTPVVQYDLQGVIEDLPEVLRGEGEQVVKRPLQGRTGFFYPTGAFDVRVSGVETRDTPALAGRTLDDGMQWVLVTLDVRSRFDRTLPVDYREFRASTLIDASGFAHENIRSLYPDRDVFYDGEVEPGEIETIRLLYSIFADAEPEALILEARTPSGDDGLATRVEFTSSPIEGDASRAVLLGDDRASTFAPGIYDPLDRTVAVAEVEIPDVIVPPGEPLIIPDPPAEEDPNPEDEEAGGDPDAPGADMDQFIRNGEFRITAMRASHVQESSGDEPYYLYVKLRGVLGQPGTIVDFGVLSDRPFSYRGAGWLTAGGPYTSLGSDHIFDQQNLRPYEIYTVVMMVMEDDNSGADEVKELAQAFYREVLRRWRQTIDTPLDLDLSTADEGVQRAYAREMARVMERFFGGGGGPIRYLSGEANILAREILGGIDDDDDYLGFIGAAWANMPTMRPDSFLSSFQTDDQTGDPNKNWGFFSPSEHIVSLQRIDIMMELEFRYFLRLENRLSR